MKTLSIVTPTYNRAALLKRCYLSLKRQTSLDFEWIVVDDGSTDETEVLIASIAEGERAFPVAYVPKENGGKHTALNASHPYIHGKYVLLLDSDDELVPDAVEQVLSAWSRYTDDPEIGIVTLLKGRDPDHPNCYAADPEAPVDIMAYPRICLVSNDACEVIRAELFLRYPFPVFPGEKFLAEGALWGRVSFTSKCVYINRVIYLCDYLEDGLTNAGKTMRIRNPRGGMYHADLYMASKNDIKTRAKNGLLYVCYGFFAGIRPREMVSGTRHKAMVRLCLPFGWLLYRVWKKKYAE